MLSATNMPKGNALAEFRALRAAGKTRFDTYEVKEEERIYDEVDDEGYKKLVRRRLDEDDFVVDDNGAGYADDGREDWDTREKYDETESEEEDYTARGKAGGAFLTLPFFRNAKLIVQRQAKARGRSRKE